MDYPSHTKHTKSSSNHLKLHDQNTQDQNTQEQNDIAPPPDLGVFKTPPKKKVIGGAVLIAFLITLVRIFHTVYVTGSFALDTLFAIFGLTVVILLVVWTLFKKYSIKEGMITTPFGSIAYQDVMTYHLSEESARYTRNYVITLVSFTGASVKLDEKMFTKKDWETIVAWHELYFQHDSPWLRGNFDRK